MQLLAPQNIQLRCTQVPFFVDEWSKANEELPSSKLVLAHRRAGKSLGEALDARKTFIDWYNEPSIFKLKGDVDSYNPTMYYVAPTKVQARDIIWGYIKRYVGSLPGVKISQQSLTAKLPRPHIGDEITFQLMAAKYHDAIRGSKLRKVWLDEVQMAPRKAIYSSIGPTVADCLGNLTMTGTVQGRDLLYDLTKNFIENGFPLYIFPVTRTGVFSREQILHEKKNSIAGSFEREYMMDFYAPIEGAFFAEKLYQMEKEDEFFSSEKDEGRSIVAGVDLGIDKGFACWVAQVYDKDNGNRIEIMDFYHDYSKLDDLYNDMSQDGLVPDVIFVPHDAEHRQLSSSRVIRNKDVVKDSFPESRVIPVQKPGNQMADIENTHRHLHLLRFRDPNDVGHDCEVGYNMLKEYSRQKSQVTGQYMDQIDKTRGVDHAGDALRTLVKGVKCREGKVLRVPKYRRGETLMIRSIKRQSMFRQTGSLIERDGYSMYGQTA